MRESVAVWTFAFWPLTASTLLCTLSVWLLPFFRYNPVAFANVVIFAIGVFLSFRRWNRALNRSYKRFRINVVSVEPAAATTELRDTAGKYFRRTWFVIVMQTVISSVAAACIIGFVAAVVIFGEALSIHSAVANEIQLFELAPMLIFLIYLLALLGSQIIVGTAITRNQLTKERWGMQIVIERNMI